MIAGISTGVIQILTDNPDPTIIKVGDNLSKIRQCRENKKLIATGGKERQNRLKIWDVTTKENIFLSKNLPHDSLQLEVPIWDNDFGFIDEHCLATCSRYGYVRTYDTRAQRRPVLKHESKDQISFTCLALYDKMIFVGTTTSGMRAFDSRNLKNPVHVYKGNTGSVSDIAIDENGQYLCSTSLDRFVRIHNANKVELLYQTYIKSKGTAILIKDIQSQLNETDDCIMLKDESLIEENHNDNHLSKNDDSNEEEELDEEYERLFRNMERVNDDDDEEETTKNTEPPAKKKKKFNKKKNKKH